MVFRTTKNSELLILNREDVDLSQATLNESLSSTGLDEKSSTFHVTIDRIHFLRPVEIVLMVLEANGFAHNFENILSCLDNMTHGLRVKLHDKSAAQTPSRARSYLPCLSFELPAKNKLGYLLKKFYAEIEAYEQSLAQLRAETDAKGERLPSREQLKREMGRLEDENTVLHHRLQQTLQDLARSQASAAKSLEEQNLIPPNLALAAVRDLNLEKRVLTAKAGRRTYVVPLAICMEVPKPGDACLLNVKDEAIVAVYFHDAPGKPFQRDIGEILYVSGQSCKLRDSRRHVHHWTAKNEWEKTLLEKLKRGSKVILSSYEGVIIKLSQVLEQDQKQWSQTVQEQQTIFHLERARSLETESLQAFAGKGA